MAWVYLFIAVIIEVVWALSLKRTEGYTRLWPSLFNAALMGTNLFILATAMRDLPSAMAYSIWVGLGAAGVALGGVLIYGEHLTLIQGVSIALIMVGVFGLKMGAP